MRVLIPFDLKPASERAVLFAGEAYGPRKDVELIAVHFVKEEYETVDHLTVESVRGIIGQTQCSLDVEIIEAGEHADSPQHIGDQIIAYCEEEDVDTIVMGYNEHSIIEEFFKGSTSERVVGKRQIPVTLVP